MVATPLENGHRSFTAGDAERRLSQTRDAVAIQRAKERIEGTGGTVGSP
jgi:hypothetical protein